MSEPVRRIIVGITGASGAPYGVRLVELLAGAACDVTVIATEPGLAVLAEECGARAGEHGRLDPASLWPDAAVAWRIACYGERELGAPPASGSLPADAMVVCPCSMNTLAATAAGLGSNLLQRAALVTLKEGRRLVLVPRETPLGTIQLEAMLRLARAGATVLPAMPAFYHHPKTVADLVDFVASRVLDVLGVPHDLPTRWGTGRE